MILEKVTGCICDSLTVDGVQEIDLTDEKRVEVLSAISYYVHTYPFDKFGELIRDYFAMYTTEEDLEYMDEYYKSMINSKLITPLYVLPEDTMANIALYAALRARLGCYIKSVPPNELNWILQQVVEAFGEYEYIGHCDQCCDSIYKYTLEI